MQDADRRRLILLACARARVIESANIATRLHEDLVTVELGGLAARRARLIVDSLDELRALIDIEIGRVPSI